MSTSTFRVTRHTLYIFAAPLLTAVAFFGAALALSHGLILRETRQVQQRTASEANHVAVQLRTEVFRSIDILPRMAEWWLSQGHPAAREDWDTDAQLFLRKEPDLREVFWLNRSGQTVWCVRPGAQPDFHCRAAAMDLPSLARLAEQNGGVALSRVAVRDGARQFYACTPIRHGRLIGFVVGSFDAATLAASLAEQAHGYGLEIAADSETVATLPNSDGRPWREGAHTAAIKIADRWWSVRLIPAATDIETLQRLVWSFGLVVAVLIYGCTALALIYKRNELALRKEMDEREKAEKRISTLNLDLRHQVTDFAALLELLPVGITISNDPECRDIWMNREMAGMLRVPIEQNISHSAAHPAPMPNRILRNGVPVTAEELPMQTAARTGKSLLDLDFDIVRDDGSVLNTLSYSAPVFDENGNLRHVINACIDITDRKRSEKERQELEERLLRAEKYRSLGLMAGGIVHDFNNLLTAIIGNAELARRNLTPHDPAMHPLQEAISAATRTAELVAKLMAYTGRGWLEVKPLDLSAQVRASTQELRASMPSAIEIELDLGAELPAIEAGAAEIRQVLQNLLANSVEAIGERAGTIQVRTDRCTFDPAELARDYPDQELAPGTYVRLEVRDSGSGVPKELAARVFDPFFTTKFVGRGLGLSAVQGIMRAHRGAVRFDVSAECGACVQAIFPAAKVTKQLHDRVA